ncbi:DUF2634 domain-containing protein [Brevibacillus porteri]|uniref:DUF2634 domain-containing protein n=1 Tax=Brevibacillus porteri TaxID=2126350 RepID=A0ABX5FIC0_9BACL|nr:DUF2634 domain-containing protein [Brevibacillus porteri]MED1800293.1 DUF2634 domain-containing protein [Brevibacillus porteri]MED2130801.1 DUF2634 domain-containing protein [Brevibacillus porteri]MED2744938.1 DUF2634 domain-containing protein [Brevibacillus porteri]MED2813388.1 DUF2634 domain-containing protein [Brevibacillus porteri]MED2894985.1 DUF2634 domain-containing protein [Brevibacillus porteri]
MSIFPVFPVTDDSPARELRPIKNVLRTYKFDFETGQFAVRPDGKSLMIDGEEALLQKATKALHTDRYMFSIYSSDYGNELKELIRSDGTRAWKQAEAKRLVREALEYLYGIERCEKFSFQWESNILKIFFEIITEEGVLEMVIDV